MTLAYCLLAVGICHRELLSTTPLSIEKISCLFFFKLSLRFSFFLFLVTSPRATWRYCCLLSACKPAFVTPLLRTARDSKHDNHLVSVVVIVFGLIQPHSHNELIQHGVAYKGHILSQVFHLLVFSIFLLRKETSRRRLRRRHNPLDIRSSIIASCHHHHQLYNSARYSFCLPLHARTHTPIVIVESFFCCRFIFFFFLLFFFLFYLRSPSESHQ